MMSMMCPPWCAMAPCRAMPPAPRAIRRAGVAAAVVGQKQDQGVLLPPGAAQRLENGSHVAVHAVDLRRVDLHAPLVPLPVGGILPGRDLLVARGQTPLPV